MTDVLLPAVLLVSILLVTIVFFAVAIRKLLSSRRSEVLSEDRYELLRDHDYLLEQQFQERQQSMEYFEKTPPQLVEDLKKERGEHLEAQERIENLKHERLRLEQELRQLREQLERERRGHLESRQRVERLEREQKEQSATQLEVERLGQECQRLTEDLEREREKQLAAQQRAKQQQRERARLEREFRGLNAKLDSHRRASNRDRVKEWEASHPRWRRPVLIIGLLFGALIAWLTSLMVALYLLSP
jgi:chromosome segregation ATPase